MTTADARTPIPDTVSTMKRRGLFAAAWAAMLAFVLKQTTQPVEATVSNLQIITSDTNSYISNFPSTPIRISNQSPFGTALSGTNVLRVEAFSVPGVDAIVGDATVGGRNGVVGVANATSSIGVQGTIPSTSGSNATAVYGLNYSTYTGGAPGAGGFAVYGLSAKGHGLVGATAAAGAAAVVGATNGVAGAYAAAFYGPVVISGDFTVVGGAKSAAVPHPDGSHRRLYCMESPESWFEDFGHATLAGGCAEIAIDPDFAALVDLTSYHVFLTEYDDHTSLFVTRRTPTGFSVHSKQGTDGSFSWRVVAKRKDIEGRRLESVTGPAEPALPPVPETPTAVRSSRREVETIR